MVVEFNTNLKGLNEIVFHTSRGEIRVFLTDEEAECLASQIVDKFGFDIEEHLRCCGRNHGEDENAEC